MRATYAVGVDVGGTKISAGLVERKGRMVREARLATPQSGPFGIVDGIIEAVQDVTGGIRSSEVAGVGLGLPAQIDFHRQAIEFCTNLPLAGVDVRGLVTQRVRREVTIDNDGHLAAIGEARYGAGKGARDFLMVAIGTGVGGGLYLDGRPYRGRTGLGGELGHIVVDLDGPPCPCGGHGHLESTVSGPAIARMGREAAAMYRGTSLKRLAGGDPEAVTSETVVTAAQAGDKVAREILTVAARTFGRALVGMVNLLNPELIVVGGGLGEAWPPFIEQASEAVQAEALAGRKDVRIVRAELGNDAGVLGAAALAFDEYDEREGLGR